MSVTPEQIAIIVLAAVAVVAIIGWLFRKDDAIEERRKNMMKLYAKLNELGLERLGGFAQAYVVGDYSGLYEAAHELMEDVMDPAKATELLAKAFYVQLTNRLKDPIEKIKIMTILNSATTAATTVAAKTPAAAA